MTTATANHLSVNRKTLVKALEDLVRVLPTSSAKPILQGIHLQAADGMLWLSATDLETSLLAYVPADEDLPCCVVPGRDLLQRVKAGRTAACNLELQDDQLLINGGLVQHELQTLPVAEYPPIKTRQQGKCVHIRGDKLRAAMEIALTPAARDPSRYAINGVLLEVKDGVRLVATDGRRLVSVEIAEADTSSEVQAILPMRFCRMLLKLVPKGCEDPIQLYVDERPPGKDETKQPSDLYAVGNSFLMHAPELEGKFPDYQSVVPRGGSKFLLDRGELLATLKEVSLACGSVQPGVHVRLQNEQTIISAGSDDGASSGSVRTRFLGGGDSLILTAFNPDYLLDVVQSVPGDQLMIEVQQNKPTGHGHVSHCPAVFCGWPERLVNWVLMPISTKMAETHDSLGSNGREQAA
jgi:DNA polymerase III subunit beta